MLKKRQQGIESWVLRILGLLITPFGSYLFLYYIDKPNFSPVFFFLICIFYIVCLFRRRLKKIAKPFQFIFVAVFSFLFSLMLIMKSHIVFSGIVRARINQNYFTSMGKKDALFFILLSIFLFVILLNVCDLLLELVGYLNTKSFFQNEVRVNGKKWIFIVFAAIILVWGVSYLSFFPGTSMWNDIDAVLAFGPVGESGRSPIIYNYIVYFFLELLCDPLTNPNLGFALFTIFQMVFMAGVITYVLYWTYYIVRVRNIVFLTLFAFFCFYPVVNLYSFTIVKDTPYSLFMLLWIPFLYDTIKEKKLCLRNKILYCFLIVGSAVFRNNGLIVVPLLIIATVFVIKNNRRYLLIAGAAVYLFVIISTNCMTKNVPRRFAEAVGVPLQQIAMVLTYDGNIEEEEKEFLLNIKKEEYWTGLDEQSYSPMNVDSLKLNYEAPIEYNSYVFSDDYLNKHKAEFIKTYLHILVKNPSLCIKAWLMNTYGFWAFNTSNTEQAFMTAIHTSYYQYTNRSLLPKSINSIVQVFYSKLSVLTGSAGSLIWLTLFLTMFLLIAGKGKNILLLLPILLNWLTLLAFTPMAFGFRYVFFYLLCLPVIFALLPTIFSNKHEESVQ